MTDEKKLRGEEEHTISQGEINAWNRSKNDAARNKMLSIRAAGMSPEKAVKLIKLYAALGDIHYVAIKLDLIPEQVRRILKQFSINSIEDAKTLLRDGVIADFDAARDEQRAADEATSRIDHEAAQARLDEQIEAAAAEEPTELEVDQRRAERLSEATARNKQDRIRQLIADGIDPQTKTSNFRVPINRVGEFKSLVHHGVAQLQRRFGGTKADIVNEVKRLAPNIDTNMLRP